MDKTYEPKQIEQDWYQRWEENGYFEPSGAGEPFCIMIPPPNVTGTLHMGHAFQDTIMDALTRYYRMKGRKSLWQPGTDHAGIATQMVVERQLNQQGLTRQDIGRDAFIERIWEWKDVSGGAITRQLRRMGASVDWAHERFTMDEGLSSAVKETFVQLYDEGLIYRGKRLVNWDPVLHTAVSDLEVQSEERDGFLWHIKYPLEDGSGHLIVATTRPETMLGDTAVAVHPEDERYQQLIGARLSLPLTDRSIQIVADEMVDPKFGSGCVKITPAHDFNDFEVGERHGLEVINILEPDARLNDNVPARYAGLDRFDARKRIIEDLTAQGLLEKTEPHRHVVPLGDRSQSIIEPYLTDQWFVKVKPLAEEAIRAVEDGRIRFVPEHWAKTYFEWLRNIEDWCISRQIWWGHRIPAWYDPDGNVYVGRTEEEARRKHGISASIELVQDDDVLDTWYSSGLWPFSTLGWPADTERLKTFYPSSVLVTGFDIIFFWVARMVMFGLKFMGDVPFREVYIHGLIRDADGQKMSKSKGNILDPLDLADGITLDELIAKRTTGLMQPQLAPKIVESTRKQFAEGIQSYGTDALRFTFCSLATLGRDISFDLGRIEGYRNFCNKLWNAARFVLSNTESLSKRPTGGTLAEESLSAADRWIISRLQRVEANVGEHIEQYRFDLAAQAIYDFTWNEYCDWYVELTKCVLYDEGSEEAALLGTRLTLARVLEALLRLTHPIMPFITEAIWQQVAPLVGKEGDTIMTQPFPESTDSKIDVDAETELNWVKGVVLGVRQIRGEMNIDPRRGLPVLLQNASPSDRQACERHGSYLERLARISSITVLGDGQPAPEAALALYGDLKILIPLEGVIDRDAERARLEKQKLKETSDLEKVQAKLANPKFIDRAPPEVVAKERERLSALTATVTDIEQQLARLG